MAHGLVTAKDMFYVKGELPWHGLGVNLKDIATAEEAIEAINFAYEVVKLPTYVKLPWNGKEIALDDNFATVRRDNDFVLGSKLGKRYQVVQNKELFSFFDPIVERDEAIYHTGGILNGGKRVWLLAKLPEYIKVGGEFIDQYVLLCSSHNGTIPTIAKFTPVRVVCNNTLTVALSGAEQRVSVRHTTNAIDNLKNAHKILGIVNTLSQQLEEIFNKMTDIKVTDETLAEYISNVFPTQKEQKRATKTTNIRNKVLELVYASPGAELESAKGTLWGAYNAITYYADHVNLKKDDDDKRVYSVWFGTSSDLKNRAFDEAIKFLN